MKRKYSFHVLLLLCAIAALIGRAAVKEIPASSARPSFDPSIIHQPEKNMPVLSHPVDRSIA